MCVLGGSGGWFYTTEKFSNQLGVLPFNSILMPSTQRQHQIPQAKASVQDCPSLQMPITSPGCYLCFGPTDYKSEGPTTPSLNSINLPEWLTELKKPVCSLDDRFITKVIKGCGQQPDEEIHKVRFQTKELLISWSLGPITWTVLAPNLKALQTPLFWVFNGGFIT